MTKFLFPILLLASCIYGTSFSPKQIPVSDGFDYPVGPEKGITGGRDGDGWYNANDFGNDRHLGEDWNGEKGGNTDCDEPVYAISIGVVIYAGNAGFGWGNVVIIRHKLPDASEIESQYAHLKDMLVASGDTVERRQKIGTIGDGRDPCGDSKPYYAHLHFEMRTPESRAWGAVGPGYSDNKKGWIDPSEFIDSNRNFD